MPPVTSFASSKVPVLAAVPSARRRDEVTSHEVGCSPECCERRPCRLIGLPAATCRRGFPRALVAPPSASSPVPLRDRVHPLLSLASSSEFERLEPAPRTDTRSAFLEVSFPIAASVAEIHSLRASEEPPPLFGPSPAFRTPSTVFALRYLVGLFHPTTTSGIRLSGACSHHPASPPRRRSVPSCRCPPAPCLELPRDSSSGDLAFRALLRAAIRGDRRGS
jgi:hypothetical protein